jgi:hypothetical protein
MIKISLPRRYWNSLTCIMPSHRPLAASRSLTRHHFWRRYWASFIVENLPTPLPVTGKEAAASLVEQRHSAYLPSVAEQSLPDILVLDGDDGKAHDLAPRPLRARLSYWAAPSAAAATILAIVIGLALIVPAGISRLLPGSAGPGTFPGLGPEAVSIRLTSLPPTLAAAFSKGRTAGHTSITGFEFRNTMNANLCLSAPNTGSAAGRNGDPVTVENCKLTSNEIWIPEQWEIDGSKFTKLISYQHPSMCLNANSIGGLHNGDIAQLWDCYPADNESWNFGEWYNNVKSGIYSYPIFVKSGRLCLDADKYDLRAGVPVRIWTHYSTANQFWS